MSFEFGFGGGGAAADPPPAVVGGKKKKSKKEKKRKSTEEPEEDFFAEDAADAEPPTKKKKKNKEEEEEEEKKSEDADADAAEDDAVDPPPEEVKITASEAMAGQDIDRALKLAEKQRQKEKRAAKKAQKEKDASKASKKAKYGPKPGSRAPAPHDKRTSETPLWMACQEYLETWKKRKGLWKFQKVRQIWLLQHMYDTELVTEPTFAIMIEYLGGLKGAGRTTTLEEAEKVLSKSAEAAAAGGGAEEDGDGEGEVATKESKVQQRAAAVIEVLQHYEQ